MNDMDDMDDKLIQMLRASGAEQCNSAGTLFMVSVKDAAAYRSAILADAAKDVEPVGEVILNYSTQMERCHPDGPMNEVVWLENATAPKAGTMLVPASTLAAAQALNAELVARVEGLEKDAALQWPKQRRVGRREDMSPDGFMVVGLDSDNDVYIAVTPSEQGYRTGIEFCNGGGGGGSSMRTREALINLMTAIEADNASRPDKAFPPVDAAIAARSGT